MRHLLLLILLSFLSLQVFGTVTAQTDDHTENIQTSDVSEVPIVGWYLVPILGAMRRRHHELNDRHYPEVSTQSIIN